MRGHEFYMQRCLELALKAEGRTSPNPLVGAVVVDAQGNIVGEGYHQRAGEPHAEVFAIDAAGERARGATLYVSLEPCCHHGRTPPCSDKVIASGVSRVVFGLLDPNPRVAGGGKRALEAAGISVEHGVLEHECRVVNRAFLKWVTSKTPWVCLKIAATLDGRIADRNGKSKWITGEQARAFVHELRNRFDAVLIGAGTARADDPELTVRGIAASRNPTRLIVDPRLTILPSARLCQAGDDKTWIFASDSAIAESGRNFPEHVGLIASPVNADGRIDPEFILRYAGEHQLLSILCEGGSALAGSLLGSARCANAQNAPALVDELMWIIAAKLLGDDRAIAALSTGEALDLSQALVLSEPRYQRLGSDMLVHAFLSQP